MISDIRYDSRYQGHNVDEPEALAAALARSEYEALRAARRAEQAEGLDVPPCGAEWLDPRTGG